MVTGDLSYGDRAEGEGRPQIKSWRWEEQSEWLGVARGFGCVKRANYGGGVQLGWDFPQLPSHPRL